MVSPENVQTSNVKRAEHVVFIYLRAGYVCVKRKITKGKETVDLKDSKREPIRCIREKNGKGEITLVRL